MSFVSRYLGVVIKAGSSSVNTYISSVAYLCILRLRELNICSTSIFRGVRTLAVGEQIGFFSCVTAAGLLRWA